jgi:titin
MIGPVFADSTVPSAPTGFSGTAVSPTQVNLFWNMPSGFTIIGYKIEYKTSGGSYATLVTTTGTSTATNTYYSHTGLVTGTVYSYKIYAINSVGTSVASGEITITPATSSAGALPGSPTGLVATPVSPTQATLSWSAPSNGGHPITGYKIEYRIGSGSYTELVPTTGSTITTYLHTGMTAGQVYVYRIYAITTFGQSEKPSSETTVTLKSASSSSAPGAPPGLSATAVSPTQVNLSWSAPSNNGGYSITGYKIEVKKGAASYSTLTASTGNSTTTYAHAGLVTGTTYSYKVYAINSIGTSTASPEASTTPTTTSISSSPAPPTGLIATSSSATQINLSWSAPSNIGGAPITGYKIEAKKGPGSYEVLVANTASTVTSYAHAGLTTGTQYYYRVYAINSIGTSSPSGESSATPKETTIPTLTGFAIAPTKIYLSWTAPSQTYKQSIGGYKIEQKLGDSYKVINDNTGNVNSFTINDVITGKTYIYTITAIFSAGSSPRSNEVSIIPSSTSAPPAGFSTNPSTAPTPTPSKLTGTDPQSILKAQQDEVKRKALEAIEAMKKQSGQGDSDKAKAAREEAQKANEKARQEALAAKQKLAADKKAAAIKAQEEKTANQTSQQKPAEITTKKPKTLEEARKLAEEAKQKALEKANIETKKSDSSNEEKQKALDVAKAAAWEKAKKALEELKAKSQK